jgi:hypothetical protein
MSRPYFLLATSIHLLISPGTNASLDVSQISGGTLDLRQHNSDASGKQRPCAVEATRKVVPNEIRRTEARTDRGAVFDLSHS